ncbi:MAG: hypothetical protein ABIH72_05485 [archaeon]
MEIIDSSNINQARKQIDKISSKKEKVIVQGKDIEFNRKILENKKVSALILNHENKHDKLKQRDSGLNQVLCKIARDNNITLILDFNEILRNKYQERAKILARVMQNLKLIKKYKASLKIINYKDEHNARALLLTLGLGTDLAKKSIQTLD